MDPPDTSHDSGHCASCAEARTKFFTNSCHDRNSAPPRTAQIPCRQTLASWNGRSLTRPLNIRWQFFLHCTLVVMLLFRTGHADATCTGSDPFEGYRLDIPDEQLKRQRSVLSERECVDTCCLKTYCDAVWIIDGSCYHIRCKSSSECIPLKAEWPHDKLSGTVYIMRRSAEVSHGDSGIHCSPFEKWDTCPVSEHCNTVSLHCECDSGMTRSSLTNHCKTDPLDITDSSSLYGKYDHAKQSFSYDPANPEGTDLVDSGLEDHNSWMDNLRFCKSDEECEVLEYCFGLGKYPEGICQCVKGYHMSEELSMCVRESLKGDSILPTIGPPTEPPPLVIDHSPDITPITTGATPPPGAASLDGGTNPVEKTNTSITDSISPETGHEIQGDSGGTDVSGVEGGTGVEVAGTHPGSEIAVPDKKSGGDVTGQPENRTEPKNVTENKDLSKSSPLSSPEPKTGGDTQTYTHSATEGATKGDGTAADTLVEKEIRTMEPVTTPNPTTQGVPTPKPLTTVPPVIQLTVSAGQDKILQLPDENNANLFAYVVPETQPSGKAYSYEWRVLSGKTGVMGGEHSKQLQLDGLSAGIFRFQVEVRGEGSYGSAKVNVTVLLPPRVNQPPKAVINPPSQDVILPNPDTFLDGSDSTDDDNIVSYHWEEVEGPVREQKITGDTQTLQLTDLVPGSYVISLTVTDSDGVTNSTLANVTVKEEIDNPPVAKAGKDVIIKLPVNSAILYGNSSFDDHPDLAYEWSKVNGPVADMSGSSLAILRLNSLEEGTYVFRLTVTDSKGKKDSDEATIIVKPENNLPPTADAGPDKELSLPDDSTTLDASDSTDDLAITTYHWEKVSGPNDPDITDGDKVVATVSGLIGGHYLFKLTVGDKQGATNSDTVDVIIKKEINIPPVAHAGPDIAIQLPNDVVELDGSESSDDKGIVSYDWKRDSKSPAAGYAIGNTAHEPVFKLRSLVAGTYRFTLNVTDAKGASNTDTVVVTVGKDPHKLNLVEITFDVDVAKFTQQDKVDMVRSLAVLLSIRDEDVNIQEVFHTPNEQLQVVFYATNATSHTAIPGPTVVKILTKKKLSSETDLLKFRVLEVDTMICQRNCSNHGVCNPYTKLCVCESFWIENYFRTWLGDGQSNCDWSILYVIIVACFLAIGVGGLCWLCICCIKKRRKKVKRRRRYNLLSQDLDGQESMEMLPKKANGKQSSSIMISESDDDSDEETTLFDSKKRQGKNGKANGSVVAVQPRKKRPFPLISSNSRTEKL